MNLTIGNNTMSSREIAELTGKQHSKVTRVIGDLHDKGIAKSATLTNYVNEQNGQQYTEFWLCKRDSFIVVARLSPEFTAAIVDRWQELESKQVPLIPQNFAQALQLAADQAKQLELAAPKIEFHDSIVNDSQTFSTRDAAKKIQQRPIKFGEWLKINGYLCLNGRAAQKYIDMGLFVTHTGISESDHAYTQTRMTGKGCAYFNNKLFEVKL